MTTSSIGFLPEGAKILVTGATGFIGAHCVIELLKKGYYVRAGARSMKKLLILKESVGDMYSDMIELCEMTDIRDLDDLQKATEDVEGVLHLASPFTYHIQDNVKDLLEPAVDGTVNILKAALNQASIKRIVVTSSFAAIYDASKGLQPGYVYTEDEFSPLTWEEGASTKDPAVAYRASKGIAEKEAWKFMKEEKPHFDLTVICPTMVFGPLAAPKLLESVEDLNLSNEVIWKVANSLEIPPTKGPLWVDVRDLAWAHVKALSVSEASNQRYLVSAGDYDTQEIADCLRKGIEKESFRTNIPIGTPGKRLSGSHFTTDSSKAKMHLGIKFKTLQKSVVDFCNQMIFEIDNGTLTSKVVEHV